MSNIIKHIKVKRLPIRFGQFLKLADLVQDGVEAKLIIQNGNALVNGSIETRRGRQMKAGDTVTLNKITVIVVKSD